MGQRRRDAVDTDHVGDRRVSNHERESLSLQEQAEQMSAIWRERVHQRNSELEAMAVLPPLQRKITFGDYISIKGELVGRIPTLTDFLQQSVEHGVSDQERDFLTACALYDAHMGWFACDITSEEGTRTGVIHVAMCFPIDEQLHNAMVAVGCDTDRLNPSDRQSMMQFIQTDADSTEGWTSR